MTNHQPAPYADEAADRRADTAPPPSDKVTIAAIASVTIIALAALLAAVLIFA